jgi:hypothetical protein
VLAKKKTISYFPCQSIVLSSIFRWYLFPPSWDNLR